MTNNTFNTQTIQKTHNATNRGGHILFNFGGPEKWKTFK